MRIIFVCTGNTCRSPMAEGYMKQRLRQDAISDIEVISRGLMAPTGQCATENAIRAMKKHGIDISGHRAKQFTEEELRADDILLALSDSHLPVLKFEAPSAFAETLGAFSGKNRSVPDPYGMGQEIYDETANIICEMVDAALLRILRERK